MRGLMAIDIQAEIGTSQRWVLTRLKRILKILGAKKGTWTIRAVCDDEMVEMHDRTMGLRTTTDVLTFDMREGRKGGAREGAAVELETMICVDEARRRAKEMGHAVRKELLLYCVHSLLHVQGYDDVTAVGARRMHAREDALLVAIGVGAVYGGGMERKPRATGRKKVGKGGTR